MSFRIFKRNLTEIAWVLVVLTALLLVGTQPPSAGQANLACQAGPLSLGMKIQDAQRLLGGAGFPGLRDDGLVESGRYFLGPSNEAILELSFERSSNSVRSIGLSSRQEQVKGLKWAVGFASSSDWRTPIAFEDWGACEGIHLNDSVQQVLHLCGVGLECPDADIKELLIVYRAGNGDPSRAPGIRMNHGSIRIDGKAHAVSHELTVEFAQGKVQYIKLGGIN